MMASVWHSRRDFPEALTESLPNLPPNYAVGPKYITQNPCFLHISRTITTTTAFQPFRPRAEQRFAVYFQLTVVNYKLKFHLTVQYSF